MQAPASPAASHSDVPPSFMIPSIHDETELECRIYHPKDRDSHRAAVVAHPYGLLGGCFDDGVVQTIVAALLSESYIVGIFNFRGAGASKGRTSWSSKPEIADYISFVGFFLSYLRYFQPTGRHGEEAPLAPSLSLTLGGYSYGALATMSLPPMDLLIDRFLNAVTAAPGRLEEEIHRQAKRHEPSLSLGGKLESIRSLDLTVSYLLVSPVLPPLSWAIAMPLSSLFRSHHGEGANAAEESRSESKLHECLTLAIYSDNDQFTAVKKFRKWSADLQKHDKSRFAGVEVTGAGHFWLSEGAPQSLQQRIREWLQPAVEMEVSHLPRKPAYM